MGIHCWFQVSSQTLSWVTIIITSPCGGGLTLKVSGDTEGKWWHRITLSYTIRVENKEQEKSGSKG